MQNQFAVYMAAMFGFTSCSELVTDETNPELANEALVGTWVEVRTTRTSVDSDADWVSTHRKTIIVEKVGETLRFRNCIDDSSATATVSGDQVTLSSDRYPILNLSEPDVLSGAASVGNTSVSLRRVSEYTSAVLASLELSDPREMKTWTQLCLETLVADQLENRVGFKASNSLAGVTVGMTFVSMTPFVADQYLYPAPGGEHDASGAFVLPGSEPGTSLSGNLSNPSGTVVVSATSSMVFNAALTMTASPGDEATNIGGLLEIDPEWFDTELQ